jgi:hypothetical protein
MGEVAVNFVAFDETQDCCLMVLVEEGWTGPIDADLRVLQDRLYGCVDAALDGQLAGQFPESRGKAVVIRVDCYDLDREVLDDFVSRFAEGVSAMPDYSTKGSPYLSEIRFEVTHDSVAARH